MGTIKKLKSKLPAKGSVLVFTLIILFIILAAAIGISSVSVLERKGARSTDVSVQSFQIANSGAERILKIIDANKFGTFADIGCTTTNRGKISSYISSGKDYEVTFYKNDGSQITQCDTDVSAIDKIKSVGSYANTARAIEVAVAATYENGNNCNALDISEEQGDATLVNAVRGCRDLGSGWYLPTAEELACFVGASGVSVNSLSTRTPYYSLDNAWVVIRLTDGTWTGGNYTSSYPFRCVR